MKPPYTWTTARVDLLRSMATRSYSTIAGRMPADEHGTRLSANAVCAALRRYSLRGVRVDCKPSVPLEVYIREMTGSIEVEWWGKARELKAQGIPTSEIAVIVNRSVNSVNKMFRGFRADGSSNEEAPPPKLKPRVSKPSYNEAEVVRLHKLRVPHTHIASLTKVPYIKIVEILENHARS